MSSFAHDRSLRLRALACAVLLSSSLVFVAASAPAVRAAGFEGNDALQQLDEGAAETTTTQATTATNATETTNSKSVILLASAGAIVLLCVIGFVIARDARRVAPAGEEDVGEGRPAKDQKVIMERRRAKAKAARKQRKRTRAR